MRPVARLVAVAFLSMSVAQAADIAMMGDQAFDQVITPTVKVPGLQNGSMAVILQAWADPALGPQALDVERLDEHGKLLGRLNDIAPASPFAPGIQGQVLVPVSPDTRLLRFRVRGRGPAAGAWTLRPDLPLSPSEDRSIHNGDLHLDVAQDGRSMAVLRRGERIGRLELAKGWRVGLAAQNHGFPMDDPSRILLLEGPQGEAGTLEADFPVRCPACPVASRPIRLALNLRGTRAREFTLSFLPEGAGAWYLPFNQGLRVPVDQAAGLDPGWDLDLRSGHFISMPAFGWDNGAAAFVMASTTPADEAWRLRFEDRRITWVFRPSQGVWDVHRIALGTSEPGAAAWVRAYKQDIASIPASRREGKPLPRSGVPPGAVNIHYWKKVAWWNNEPHPEALAAEMKADGLDRVLWSQTASPEAVAALNAQGWLTGSYENFQDVYPSDTPMAWTNKDGWPEQAVMEKGGWWRRGWPAKENGKTYYAGVRSPRAAVDYVRAALDKLKARGQGAVFLDTTTASGPVEDWSPLHPMTRSQDLAFKRRQLAYGKSLGLVVGSESGHDGALGAVDYFEGMQSPWCGRFEDAGYELGSVREPTPAMQRWILSPRYRAPLFDLAWRPAYVGYEYWGDAANRLPKYWRRRDLFSVLYAQPQLWIMDEERWRTQKAQAIQSYKTWSPVVRHLSGQRMTDWKVLDRDGDVQETHWEDGSVVRVDFAKDRIELEGPVKAAVR